MGTATKFSFREMFDILIEIRDILRYRKSTMTELEVDEPPYTVPQVAKLLNVDDSQVRHYIEKTQELTAIPIQNKTTGRISYKIERKDFRRFKAAKKAELRQRLAVENREAPLNNIPTGKELWERIAS